MSAQIVLHSYFRSTASWRVRIALNLKGVAYDQRTHSLRRGEQRDPAYLSLNPQGLVPTLEIDGLVLTQSLAICDYLDTRDPEPRLLPPDPVARAKQQAAALAVACDIHPVQNLKVLQRVRALGVDEDGVQRWAAEVITEGLAAFAALLPPGDTPFCFDDRPGLADVCLIPQMGNADRFGATCPPRLEDIRRNCAAIDAFARAEPQRQPDAV